MVRSLATRWPLLWLAAILGATHCSPAPEIEGRDGAPMLLIPEGAFPMGGREHETADHPHSQYLIYQAERPVHQVTISSFYMDKYEVTNARYRQFVEAVKERGDSAWRHPDQKGGRGHGPAFVNQDQLADELPAVGISWYSAYAYCQWAGKRLPTEAEWEYAARGPEYRTFPWGDEAPGEGGIWRSNFAPEEGKNSDGFGKTAAPGSYPDGASPFGIHDMSGNAEEWVNDWLDYGYFKKTEGATDPQGPETGKRRVIKGGSFLSNKYQIRIGTRLFGTLDATNSHIGFRCAQDL